MLDFDLAGVRKIIFLAMVCVVRKLMHFCHPVYQSPLLGFFSSMGKLKWKQKVSTGFKPVLTKQISCLLLAYPPSHESLIYCNVMVN